MATNKTNLILLLILFVITSVGCGKSSKKDFFFNLKGAKIDMKISSDSYFLKSFGIASKPLMIMNNSYWRLKDNEKSRFYLEGYLRNDGDSIMILPCNYGLKKDNVKTYKLFDFSLNHQKSWKLLFKLDPKNSEGASITFINKRIVKEDTLYNYSLTPFVYHNRINVYDYGLKPTFNISVSKTVGIVTIAIVDPINNRIMYEAMIYPKRKFVNNMGNLHGL